MRISQSRSQSQVTFGRLCLLLGLLILAMIVSFVNADLEPITPKERKEIEKLRRMVDPLLTKEYMHADAWLVTFIRAKKGNLNDAKAMIEKTMEWRRQNNMDNFLDEDWSKFDRGYGSHIKICGVGRSGQVINHAKIGRWDFRRIVLAGQASEFVLYFIYHMFEKPLIVQYEASRRDGATIQNATVGVGLLADMTGFTVRQHLCLGCIGLFAQLALVYERSYPRHLEPFIVVNSPAAFDVGLNAGRAIFTPHPNKHMQVYRVGRENWSNAVDKSIAIDQVPTSLGGKKQCPI